MLLVSLVGDAKIVVPDSLLDVKKSYLFFITSPDTAHAIINTLRERKAVPEWRLDLAEGDMYYNARRYLTALTYYNKVDGREEISDSIHIQLLPQEQLRREPPITRRRTSWVPTSETTSKGGKTALATAGLYLSSTFDVSNCIIFGNLSGILGANVETSSDAHGDGTHGERLRVGASAGIWLICA